MQESEPEAESQIFTMGRTCSRSTENAQPGQIVHPQFLILGVNEGGGEVVAQSSPSELLIQTEQAIYS